MPAIPAGHDAGQRAARMLLAGTVLTSGKVREATEQLRLSAASIQRDPGLLLDVTQKPFPARRSQRDPGLPPGIR